jgi:hypothetical protein
VDSCEPATGCVHSPAADGTECGARSCSGLNWNMQICQAGACTGSVLVQSCNDGKACTTDSCSAGGCSHGNAANGTACETDNNACTNDVCSGGACTHPDRANGSSCGSLSSQRCCGGSCVDIRSNENNCGGCGAACSGSYTCEDVASTTSCSPHPTGTSGRCRCTSTSHCPQGQICRTSSPYAGRCAPENSADCPGRTFVDVSSCPNYCRY